ncbi:MAG: sulfatase [bacterium]|nr:sulfatase [bacterium]
MLRAAISLVLPLALHATAQEPEAARPPNVIVIFIDDLAYADIGPFGADIPTPNLDRMAKEGMKFTDFLVSTAVCSASRAALLTGCYNRRIGISGAYGPRSKRGIHEDEVTLAELCKQKGYATACFGKWHLGHHPKFLPLQHGFDEYYGLPYSNDMWPLHPAYAHLPTAAERRKKGYPDLPLIDGNEVVDREVTGEDQKLLTKQYTERAVSFIERKKDQPFFLYVPHSMVHVPLFVSKAFEGKSGKGLFGDVVMEVDWSVGQILDALEEHGLTKNTLVVFTGDNGPWLSYGDHAGSAGPFREGKGTMFEGGIREPTVMWWPGRIPAGTTCDELSSTIDLLPTVAKLIDAKLPDHPIDGRDIRPLMFGADDAKSPHQEFYCYYAGGQLQAVRDRRWKLHLPHKYRTLNGREGGKNGSPVPYEQGAIGVALYDLKNDPGESTDVQAEHPEVMTRLLAAVERARTELGDRLTKRKGRGVRPAGQLKKGDPELKW